MKVRLDLKSIVIISLAVVCLLFFSLWFLKGTGYKKEFKLLEQQYKNLQHTRDSLQRVNLKLKSDFNKTQKSIDDRNKKIKQIENELNKSKSQLNKANSELSRNKKDLDETKKKIEDLKKTIKFKTNEKPIEQIQVGRGLAIGSEVPAAGGFQQYTRIMPDNISDYSANQLPGMVAGEKWAFSNAPTSQAPVAKNRVNKYYTLCDYGPGPGRSTVTAEATRPDYSVVLKNQNRAFINYGFGTPLMQLSDYLPTN